VLVQSVARGSAADKAGLEGGDTEVVVAGETYVLGGDVIVAFDGKKISSIEELRDAIAEHEPGNKAKVELFRGEKKLSVIVTLGRQPPSPQG
jgi:S1-C subfamily serine protease